jgi:Fe2+ transport system protein FeoA
MTMRLHELKDGQSAVIQSVKHQGSRLQRLLEMGFFEGSKVTLIRRAPLGDPLQIGLGDFHLSLRLEDASLIDIEAPKDSKP